MTRHDKPTKAEFKTCWSVFEAQQQRRKQRTIPPENFSSNDRENHDHDG